HVPDPAGVIGSLLGHLKPQGIVAFVEGNPGVSLTIYPPTPLLAKAAAWMVEGQRAAGVEPFMGLKLYQTFLDAGLTSPTIRAHASVTTWREFQEQGGLLVNALRGLAPQLKRLGIASDDELQLDTLKEGILAEMREQHAIAMQSGPIDAWARKP